MSALYRRLLLWFCAANVITLLVSVAVTGRIAHHAYGGELDWAALAQSADAAYAKGGRAALQDWALAQRHDEHIQATLFEDDVNLLDWPLPPPLARHLPQLLASDSIVLRPVPEVLLVGQRVVGGDKTPRQLVLIRGPRPQHAKLELLLGVQIVLSLLVIGAVGWWVARSIARPVAALQQAAQRMATGDLSARVGGRYPQARDELGLLAR
ncbi:MAG: HAMP domain-containing protein, partial [Nevskia sp.]|nr:HAMP domain-containing protein [Nevskia sp.]